MILLLSSKNIYATKRLVEEAGKLNVGIEVMEVGDLVEKNFDIDISKYNTLFIRSPYLNGSPEYIPEIITLAKKFKSVGKKVVDSVIAEGELGDGKWQDYEKFMKANLPIPATTRFDGRQNVRQRFPYVLKWIYGFKGRGVFLVENNDDFQRVMEKIPGQELMVQEYIPSEVQYNIVTVGYKALPVVLRTKGAQVIGKIDSTEASLVFSAEIPEVVKLAEEAAKLLKRELAKVDILESKGKLYILEVNRWPGFEAFEILTKYNVAGEFIKYLNS